MVTLLSLWLPILLSAIVLFVVSAILHTVLPWHNADYSKLPNEDEALDSLAKAKVPPGDYVFPHAATSEEWKTPEFAAKLTRGPVGFATIRPNGPFHMGKTFVQWFVYLLVGGTLVAYVCGRSLAPGADYLDVFRLAGTAALLFYAGAEPVMSIWFSRRWGTTLRNVIDGLIYALLTAGFFGWLWPAT